MPPRSCFSILRSIIFCCFISVILNPAALADKKTDHAAAAAEAAANGPAMQLSPFEVTARGLKFEHWIKISSPHFMIYTDASTKEATLLLRHMEMVHQAAQFFLHRKSLTLAPTIIVLPTGRSDWGKIKSIGGVEWQVSTSMVGQSRRLLIVQYDWQSDGLESVWAMLGGHEASTMNLQGPLWFWRGIQDFFTTVTFSPDALNLGKESAATYYIKRNGWMNWQNFFSVTHDSEIFTKDTDAHDRYEGQCAVFTHYLLTNSDPASLPRLLGWAAYLDAGNPPTEASFKEVFQQDWMSLQGQIDKMLHGGRYTSENLGFPPAALNFETVLGNPSSIEMRELFVVSQILNQDTKNSTLSLDALLRDGLKTDALRELFADACNRRNREDAALVEYRKIINGGTSNPELLARAAHLAFNKIMPKTSLDSRFIDDSGEIQLWCNKALEIEPLNLGASETLAWSQAYAPTIEKTQLETISRICHTLDQHGSTDEPLMAMAIARWRSGGLKQARSICDRLLASPFTRKHIKEMTRELVGRMDAK